MNLVAARGRRIGVVALAAGLAVAGTACHGRGLGAGEGRLAVNGLASVAVKGEAFKAVSGEKTLHAGDRVRVEAGSALVELPGGGHIELRTNSVLRFAAVPFLEAGDLLAVTGRKPLAVATDGADVNVSDGAARLSRSLAITRTAYRGTSSIESAGSAPLTVRAPRQATLPARGVLPDRAVAADYHPDDGWDRRYLATPYEVGGALERSARGLVQQLPAGEGTTPGFYRILLPALESQPDLDHLLVAQYGPDQNLVGASIALRAGGSFGDQWKAVFDFRDPLGAQVNWGFVALDRGILDPSPLTGDIDLAIGRAPAQFVAAALVTGNGAGGLGPGGPGTPGSAETNRGPGPGAGSGSPPSSGPGNPGGGPPPTQPPGGPPTTTPPPSTPPGTLPPPPPTGTPVDPVADPLVDTVNSLLQGVPPGSTSATSVTSPTTPPTTLPNLLP